MGSVILYSNGSAVITHEYRFENDSPISITIPCRTGDLDDVISSISVYGDVTVVAPPSYTPTNALETQLRIAPSDVIREMATKLSGAEVEITADAVYRGRLMGIHRDQATNGGVTYDTYRVVVLTENGIRQVENTTIATIQFPDTMVRSELEKALRQSFGQIKPESRMIELSIKPNTNAGGVAYVRYNTPVAAWKIRYQFRQMGDTAELEAQAIVDNDTEDDWSEALITVVTGDPMTFSTDLAEIRRPQRSRMNSVSDKAGDVLEMQPENGVTEAAGPESPRPARPFARMRKVSIPQDDDDFEDLESDDDSCDDDDEMESASASMLDVELFRKKARQHAASVTANGDFSLFASPVPISVGAKRSAIIPLFLTAVKDARAVLYYRPAHEKNRCFRAYSFTHRGNFALGKGPCDVYRDTDFLGRSLLMGRGGQEQVFLVYARESMVYIEMKPSPATRRQMKVSLAKGIGFYEELEEVSTVYRILNNRDEDLEMVMDLTVQWPDSNWQATAGLGGVEPLECTDKKRVRVLLPGKQVQEVKVREERLKRREISLKHSFNLKHLLHLNGSLTECDAFKESLELASQLDTMQQKRQELARKRKELIDDQERLVKLIPKVDSRQATQWKNDLVKTETEIRELQRTLMPELEATIHRMENDLQESFHKITLNWRADTGKSK